MNQTIPRPFLKWAGGKTQLVDQLITRSPQTYANYHEPFVGAGALFFQLYRHNKIQKAFISDLNAELMDSYVAIRDEVEEVIKQLSEFSYCENFYYSLRAEDPWRMSRAARAARMIYLNKTGYNGLYRVNRQGKFNVPFGRHKNPYYCDKTNLRAVSKALQEVEIFCQSFTNVLGHAQAGDFVYFDPPYAPLSKTANFTAYQAEGFTSKAQEQLRDLCVELTNRNIQFMLSNSATETIRELYSISPFMIEEVQANRAINSNRNGRGKLQEFIITNYTAHERKLSFFERAQDST